MVSMAYCLPVSPTVTTRMIDAEPMTMPTIVRMKRALLARKLSTASEKTSLKPIVVFALASVVANDFGSSSGLGTFVVAICGSCLSLLDAFQVGSGAGIHAPRSEEHTSELQSRQYLVCRLLLEK